MEGTLKFGSYSEQTGWFSSIKNEKYDLVSDWHGEYTIEGNWVTFNIRWQFV